MSSRAKGRVATPWLLGKRYQDLPGNSPKLTASKAIKKMLEFMDAYPRVLKIVCERVDSATGRPRKLSTRVLFAAMATEGLTGELHIKKVTRTLRALGNGEQTKYGLRWKVSKDNYQMISDWQIEYLITAIMKAFDPRTVAHNHLFYDEGVGLVIDRATGQVFGGLTDFGDEAHPDLQCTANCPGSITVEQLGNMLLADMYKFLRVPRPTAIAVDSYPIQTHYGTKSFGGVPNVGADVFEQADPEILLDNAANTNLSTTNKRAQQAAKVSRGKSSTALQKQTLKDLYAEFASKPEVARDPRSRKYPEPGPTVPGDFTRLNRAFPKVGADVRLQHSHDTGAGNTFRGAGHSRSNEVVNARDKHVGVATGTLPDGSKFPPLPVSCVASKGGSDKALAGLQTVLYALDAGYDLQDLFVDRGYTNTPTERWLTPIRKLGIAIHQDLTANQRKIKDPFTHVKIIDGWWFPEAIPPGLKELPMHHIFSSGAEIQHLQIAFNTRAAFAFRLMSSTASGGIRLRGPSAISGIKKNAQGRVIGVYGVTAKCINSKYFSVMDISLPQTLCATGEECKCSSTIQVREEDLPSSYEPLLFGTTNWYRAKGARSNVENFNSVEQKHFGVGRHSIQVLAEKWHLIHAFLLLGLCLQAIYNWACRLGAWKVDDEKIDILDQIVLDQCWEIVNTPEEASQAPPPTAS
jgi:hypothetical protein